MFNIGTLLYTRIFGEFVGDDEFGNKYYRGKKKSYGDHVGRPNTERRWVMYKGKAEPSKVPPYWHGWLHYITDKVPSKKDMKKTYEWQEGHMQNLTGTSMAYLPPGHELRGGRRDKATGDYKAWDPE